MANRIGVSMTRTRHDNDLTYCIGVVYAENETILLWLIEQGTIYEKKKQNSDVTNRMGVVYLENDTEQLWSIGPSVVCDENKIGELRDRYYKCSLC